MLKNILNLEGAQKLTKNEQKSINGGIRIPKEDVCSCYSVSWADPSDLNSIGSSYQDGFIPVGMVAVYPFPECCI